MRYYRLIIAILIFPLTSSVAENRTYELLIINAKTGQERKVISNLDPIQYPDYHPLNADETISYVDSWMCWTNGSYFKPPCQRPDQQASQQKTKTPDAQL